MQNALEAGTVRVLTPEGAIAGTGFLVSSTLVLTCAHVVQSTGTGPGEKLTIEYHLSNQAAEARVLKDGWSLEDDVAVLEVLNRLPEGVFPIRLQSSAGMQGRRFQTLGYPHDGPTQVRWAQGEILGPVPVEGYANALLQIDGKQIDKGLSGAPLIDPDTRRVVGIITGYWDVVRQANSPPLRMAYAIPIETVSAIFPALKEYVTVSDLKTEYFDERDLTDKEIDHGLVQLAELLPGRAPVLVDELSSFTRALRATRGTDLKALSDSSRKERAEAINALNSLSVEVLDVSFSALCLGQLPPAYDARSPFRGLEAFRPEDHEFFFGREELTNKLIQKLKEHPFLAVLGASGSGKSSLVMAGLIPAFGRKYISFKPGAEPLSALETALASAEEDTLLVVDQFEELFTLTREDGKRQEFISRLLENTGRLAVVVTMRVDFLGEAAPYRQFKDQIEAHQVIVPPMDSAELLKAIRSQAQRVGLRFESELSQQIVDDVTGEPGAMPLLQHALWILWQRRHGRWLRTDEYRAFGGVRQAIAGTAEEVYAQCTEIERERLRDIFLRLTRLDDDTSPGLHRDTRRRVPIRDLIPLGSDPTVTILLLDKLANARLVVKSETEVEVAHETLIQHWERLTDWLDTERKTLLAYQHLRQSAREWAHASRAPDLLYPPSRLKQVDNLQKGGYSLNVDETAFVASSYSNRKRQILQKYVFWIIALILTSIVLAAFPLRPAYYALLRQRVIKASPMLELKGGNITFGTDAPRFSDEPALETRFVDTFSMETAEVTNAKYRACVQAVVCKEPKDTTYYDQPSYNEHPVVQVTLDQATTYCAWLGRRLPDTYEWERAARGLAEEERLWPWGDSPPSIDQANIIILPEPGEEWYVPKGTLPVGYLVEGATPEGIFDLVGNVWEWTSTQPGKGTYIQRGGSWDATMESVTKIKTVAVKEQLSPDEAVGFRCVQ